MKKEERTLITIYLITILLILLLSSCSKETTPILNKSQGESKYLIATVKGSDVVIRTDPYLVCYVDGRLCDIFINFTFSITPKLPFTLEIGIINVITKEERIYSIKPTLNTTITTPLQAPSNLFVPDIYRITSLNLTNKID